MIRSMFLRLERDQEYRPRVLAACPNSVLRTQAHCAIGTSLDSVGEFVDVTRRIVEDEATAPAPGRYRRPKVFFTSASENGLASAAWRRNALTLSFSFRFALYHERALQVGDLRARCRELAGDRLLDVRHRRRKVACTLGPANFPTGGLTHRRHTWLHCAQQHARTLRLRGEIREA